MIETDPLRTLLVDADELDRAMLAKALDGRVAIDSDSGRIAMGPLFDDLSTKQQILAYLLGRKVAVLLGKAEIEPARPKVIVEETGLPRGTVHPVLKALLEERAISQESDSAYFVASHQTHEAVKRLER